MTGLGTFKLETINDHPLGTNVIKDARGRIIARFESWIHYDAVKAIAESFGVEVKK